MIGTSLNTFVAIALSCNRHAGHDFDTTLVKFRVRNCVWGGEYTNTEAS